MEGINGILPVNKPAGWTSFDVVAKLRGTLRTKKAGHAGTLDPMASGVLPVYLGNATKAASLAPNGVKRYTAGVRFGISTDTDDITGTVLKTAERFTLEEKDILSLIPEFTGKIEQVPPSYSAISRNGIRLYKLARKGEPVKAEPRQIEITDFRIIGFDGVKKEAVFDIECSAGSYIRAIARDMGDRLGVGGTLCSLVRTQALGFTLDECVTIEQAADLYASGNIQRALKPVEQLFGGLPKIELTGTQEKMLLNGMRLDASKCRAEELRETLAAVYGENGFFAVGELFYDEAGRLRLKSRKFFVGRQ